MVGKEERHSEIKRRTRIYIYKERGMKIDITYRERERDGPR